MTPEEMINKVDEITGSGWLKYGNEANRVKDQEIIFTFFEGKECPYYYNQFIRTHLSGIKIIKITCGGKVGVLYCYEKIKKKRNHLFFVDKDFDNTKSTKYLYVTKTYSIENNYCSKEFIESFSIYKMCIDDNETVKKIVKEYTNRLKVFTDSIYLLNLWAKSVRNKNINIPFNHGFFDKFVRELAQKTVYKNASISNISLEQLNEMFNTKITEEEIFFTRKKLRKDPRYMRGKWILVFTKQFIRTLMDPKDLILHINNVNKISIADATFMNDNATHADYPDCLNKFLISHTIKPRM